MASGILKTCPKCGKNMDQDNFYQHKNGEKDELCKKCITLHIDNFDEKTFLWLLERFDIPYIPWEWNSLRDKAYAKDPLKINGMSVFGKYLSKMRLKQFEGRNSWADTPAYLEEWERRKAAAEGGSSLGQTREDELKQMLEKGEISEAEYKTFVSTEVLANETYAKMDPVTGLSGFNNYDERQFLDAEQLGIPDPADDLTIEDKKYLAMKWGYDYKPSEWVALEIDYARMDESFDIQDADTENVLILLCKTNLKANQAIDAGDIDGYQKLARVQESLRKSAKFTKAQKKEEETNFVDCVGALVAYCEKEGHKIPKYEIEVDYDIVDKVIGDMKDYTKDLIYQDSALANQIEQYLLNRQNSDNKKRDEEAAREQGLESVQLTEEDYIEHMDMLDAEREADNEWL